MAQPLPTTPDALEAALAKTGDGPLEHWNARINFVIASTLIALLRELQKRNHSLPTDALP